MRFSSAIRSHGAPRTGARPERGPHLPQPSNAAAEPATPASPLPTAPDPVPDDLDQRVRLIGEWQLGEA